MTKPFILSASIGDIVLADPARAAELLPAAEAAGLDLLLLGSPDGLALDPQVIAAWCAPRLTRLAVVPLVSTRVAHPFHTARGLSAIDHLSGGLLGWCPIGEGGEAEQVADLARATRALWDGWDEDCLIIDKVGGRYLDADKIRPSHYVGTHYKTRGPVNAMRPRQGHPLLVCDARSPFAVPGIDVVIAAEGQGAPHAARRLLRTNLDVSGEALASRFASGEIDGVHFDLTDPARELALLAERFAPILAGRPAQTGTMRQRLQLPLPLAKKIKETV